MILVVSYPGEEHAADVVQRLEAQGREVLQIDMADFPARTKLALAWCMGENPSYQVETAKGIVDFRNSRVAWWRRVRGFEIDPSVVAPSMRAFAESETAQAVGGMLNSLPCIWVNPRAADDAAHHKPYQWTVAQEVGLKIPRTLVTSDPQAARRFIDKVGVGRTVFKAFLATMSAWRETRLVEHDDLERLELVRYAPVIFQEYIEGVDLRITIVGNSVFAAEIDAQKTSYPVDMRMVVGESVLRPVKLPREIQQGLLKLQRRLGLSYGAIDMRRTKNGEYIFFEVNPAGQWLFVEQLVGLPISQAVADMLTKLHDRSQPGSVH